MATKQPRIIYGAAAIAGIGGMLFGYDTGVISGAILFIKPAFQLSTVMEENVISAVLLGAMFGAAVGGGLGERLGRRLTIIAAGLCFALGTSICALAPNVWVLILGRLVVGLSIGVASFSVPLYISEIAPPAARGWLVSVNQLALTIGIVLSYLTDYWLAPSQSWRWMFAIALIPSLALVAGMWILPESPRWLVHHGATGRAKKVLMRLRGGADAEPELQAIQDSLRSQTGGWAQLWTPGVRPALLVGIALAAFQQVTGINTVIYYAPTILQSTNLGSASVTLLATTGIGLVNVLFTLVAMLLLDRIGRRPLLLTGLGLMAFSLALLGLSFALSALFGGAQGWIATLCLGLYVGAFAIGLGPVFWLLIAEIYPLSVRSSAMSIATFVNWGANLGVALTFLSLTQAIGRPGTFWLYSAVTVAALVFTWHWVPETRGKTLEQIEDHWRHERHPRTL